MAEPPPPRLPPLWLLAAAAWVGPFALHSIIPSIPRFAEEFGTGSGHAQAALTAYLEDAADAR